MDWKRLERKSEEGLFLRGGAETIQICGGYMKVSIVDVSKEIFAGGDVPKDRFSIKKTEKYSVPVYANAEKNNGLYGYTDLARVSDECVTVAARGTIGYCARRYEPFLPVVRLITVIPNHKIISNDYL